VPPRNSQQCGVKRKASVMASPKSSSPPQGAAVRTPMSTPKPIRTSTPKTAAASTPHPLVQRAKLAAKYNSDGTRNVNWVRVQSSPKPQTARTSTRKASMAAKTAITKTAQENVDAGSDDGGSGDGGSDDGGDGEEEQTSSNDERSKSKSKPSSKLKSDGSSSTSRRQLPTPPATTTMSITDYDKVHLIEGMPPAVFAKFRSASEAERDSILQKEYNRTIGRANKSGKA